MAFSRKKEKNEKETIWKESDITVNASQLSGTSFKLIFNIGVDKWINWIVSIISDQY